MYQSGTGRNEEPYYIGKLGSEPLLRTIDLNSPFVRDASNKLVRRGHWMDMDDRSLIMVMTKGIGARVSPRTSRRYACRRQGRPRSAPHLRGGSLVTAFSLIYREFPANYVIRTTSPLALNKDRLFARDGE